MSDTHNAFLSCQKLSDNCYRLLTTNEVMPVCSCQNSLYNNTLQVFEIHQETVQCGKIDCPGMSLVTWCRRNNIYDYAFFIKQLRTVYETLEFYLEDALAPPRYTNVRVKMSM